MSATAAAKRVAKLSRDCSKPASPRSVAERAERFLVRLGELNQLGLRTVSVGTIGAHRARELRTALTRDVETAERADLLETARGVGEEILVLELETERAARAHVIAPQPRVGLPE